VQSSPAARTDLRYRSQILEAARAVAKNIAEGFMRRSPLQFASFLDYAVASLAEAEDRLRDGIEEGYFSAQTSEPALVLAKRCTSRA
jgi:four helix bundle protein